MSTSRAQLTTLASKPSCKVRSESQQRARLYCAYISSQLCALNLDAMRPNTRPSRDDSHLCPHSIRAELWFIRRQVRKSGTRHRRSAIHNIVFHSDGVDGLYDEGAQRLAGVTGGQRRALRRDRAYL